MAIKHELRPLVSLHGEARRCWRRSRSTIVAFDGARQCWCCGRAAAGAAAAGAAAAGAAAVGAHTTRAAGAQATRAAGAGAAFSQARLHPRVEGIAGAAQSMQSLGNPQASVRVLRRVLALQLRQRPRLTGRWSRR